MHPSPTFKMMVSHMIAIMAGINANKDLHNRLLYDPENKDVGVPEQTDGEIKVELVYFD